MAVLTTLHFCIFRRIFSLRDIAHLQVISFYVVKTLFDFIGSQHCNSCLKTKDTQTKIPIIRPYGTIFKK